MYHQLPRLRLQDQAAVEIVGILMEILMVVRILAEVETVT